MGTGTKYSVDDTASPSSPRKTEPVHESMLPDVLTDPFSDAARALLYNVLGLYVLFGFHLSPYDFTWGRHLHKNGLDPEQYVNLQLMEFVQPKSSVSLASPGWRHGWMRMWRYFHRPPGSLGAAFCCHWIHGAPHLEC